MANKPDKGTYDTQGGVMNAKKFLSVMAVVSMLILIAAPATAAAPRASAFGPGTYFSYVTQDTSGAITQAYCFNGTNLNVDYGGGKAYIGKAEFSIDQLEALGLKCGLSETDAKQMYHDAEAAKAAASGGSTGGTTTGTSGGAGIQAGWPEMSAKLDAMKLSDAQAWLVDNIGPLNPKAGDAMYWGKAGPNVWTWVHTDDERTFRHPGYRVIMTYWSGYQEASNARACWQGVPKVNFPYSDGTTRFLQCAQTGATFIADAVGIHFVPDGAMMKAIGATSQQGTTNMGTSGSTSGSTSGAGTAFELYCNGQSLKGINFLEGMACVMQYGITQSGAPSSTQIPPPASSSTTPPSGGTNQNPTTSRMTCAEAAAKMVLDSVEFKKVLCQDTGAKLDFSTTDDTNVEVTIPLGIKVSYWDRFPEPSGVADCQWNPRGDPRVVLCTSGTATISANKWALEQ